MESVVYYRMFKLSHEDVVALLEAFKKGRSITKLADDYEVARPTIRWHLLKAGLIGDDIVRPLTTPVALAPMPTTPKKKSRLPMPNLPKKPAANSNLVCELCAMRPAPVKAYTDDGKPIYGYCAECTAALTDHSKKFFDPPAEGVQFQKLSPDTKESSDERKDTDDYSDETDAPPSPESEGD